MSDRYLDFEELRPTGEASHIPDERLSDCGGDDSQRQRIATSTEGYPEKPAGDNGVCRSCGASVPASQTKCRFCLTNHLGGESSGTDGTASEATLLGVVHLVVESSTFYGAVAKGGAAATLLASNEAEHAIDDCTLIYDLDEDPAPQLRDRWPSLPAAVQVASADGERLLAAAHDRMGRSGQPEAERHQETTARLYDESGSRIHHSSYLATVLDEADEKAWLVPALALSAPTDEKKASRKQPTVPTRNQLECQNSGRATEHRFSTHESVPDATWTGQPIWECDVCGTTRYGPPPE